jgi:hypothetical protein
LIYLPVTSLILAGNIQTVTLSVNIDFLSCYIPFPVLIALPFGKHLHFSFILLITTQYYHFFHFTTPEFLKIILNHISFNQYFSTKYFTFNHPLLLDFRLHSSNQNYVLPQTITFQIILLFPSTMINLMYF